MKPMRPQSSRREPVVPCLALLAMAVVAASGAPSLAADAPPADDDGFVRLLAEDAKDRWIGYGKNQWPKGWEIVDGVLHRSGRGGDLRTVGEYGDFDLRFGWKIAPGGNSGVMYRVTEEKGPSYHTGPEYQVLDNGAHRDGKNPLTSTGSLYGLYAPAKDAAKPVGQWNQSRILVRGNRVRHFLNGELIVDAELGGDDWNQRVAKSKFAAFPKYGKNKRGHIVLQDHGDEVWYRNMRIKELDGKQDTK